MCAARYRLRSFPKGVAAGPLMCEVYETRRIPSHSALVLPPPGEDCVIEDDERHEQEQDDYHDDGDTLLHGATSIRR